MRNLIFPVVLTLLTFTAIAQSDNPKYDPELAEEMGADAYGMKSFVFVMLRTGSNQTTDQKLIDSCFVGHLNNIQRLVEEKKLIVAGPFGKNDSSYRGIFIFDVATEEEVEEILQSDPAIKENLLKAEIYSWYGSAALPAYLEASDKIWQKKP